MDDWTLSSNGSNFDGSIPGGEPFTQVWKPVSYRAAVTYEPIRNLVFYGMYATSYDPAAADVFSVNTTVPLALTSAQIYETGVKQLFWDNRAEWTFAAYDITRRNVYVQTSDTTYSLAGEIATKGIELAGAVRPLQNIKLWANVALTQARYENFDNVVDPSPGRRIVDRQHAIECRSDHHQCRRVLSFRAFAVAGRDWRLSALCRKPLSL